MARRRSLANLIADCRQRADQVNSTFCTDAEITEWLNQELAEVYALIIQNETHPHLRKSIGYSVTTASNLYPLPPDFWRAQEVAATINGITGTLKTFMPVERARLVNSQTVFGATPPVNVRLQAENIEFQPVPSAFTATLFYTPCCPRLVQTSDEFDGFNGYEMAAIHGAVAQMQAKEESDYTFAVSQKERWVRIIEGIVSSRFQNEPDRVQDVVGMNDDWWYA